jgi:phage gp37-like protein
VQDLSVVEEKIKSSLRELSVGTPPVSLLKTVDSYGGDAEGLLKEIEALPAAYVVYGGLRVKSIEGTCDVRSMADVGWTLLIMGECLTSGATGLSDVRSVLSRCREALHGLDVSGVTALHLQRDYPAFIKKGFAVYGQDYEYRDWFVGRKHDG